MRRPAPPEHPASAGGRAWEKLYHIAQLPGAPSVSELVVDVFRSVRLDDDLGLERTTLLRNQAEHARTGGHLHVEARSLAEAATVDEHLCDGRRRDVDASRP